MTADFSCTSLEHPQVTRRSLANPVVRERAARMLRAAGDSHRLALLELLDAGSLCVTELAVLTEDNMPTVSQRLRVLKSDGLVTSKREGKHVHYSLADEHVRNLLHNILHHAAESGHR